MPVITVLPNQISLSCQKGEMLLHVLQSAGLIVESPCGGRGTCGKCRVRVGEGEVLACQTAVVEDITVTLPQGNSNHQVLTDGYMPDFVPDRFESGYGVAIDIGTTTVVAALIDLQSGHEVASASDINPQKQYGLDVLSRITYEVEQGEAGIRALQNCLIAALDDMIAQLCRTAQITQCEIQLITVAANCTMMHTLLGADARSIGRAPYMPSFTEAKSVRANDIGLSIAPDGEIYCLPHVSGYIGADIVAGVHVCDLAHRKGNVLFIDIGTNGEIVLKTDNRLLCCSCAAGPALEGMNISSGMRAADGAVEDLHITPDGIELQTIGQQAPQGLCGSGILAAIRELLRQGFVNQRGQLLKKEQTQDWRSAYLQGEGRQRRVVLGERVVVSQEDVRQVQLAKGAILSGFTALLGKAGLSMEQLDEVLIAGQFGAHLPAESLIGVGILPPEVANKLLYVGNTSKTGAYMTLMRHETRRELEALSHCMEYFELAQTPDYDRIFAQSMRFPQL